MTRHESRVRKQSRRQRTPTTTEDLARSVVENSTTVAQWFSAVHEYAKDEIQRSVQSHQANR
jgi:hypothetical protein